MTLSEQLLERIRQLEAENAALKSKGPPVPLKTLPDQLSLEEYRRYGRQMLVPGFGSLSGQLLLKNARVLVVGAGGLGCPALLYLCGAGVGTIGILDNDTVDISNLHRQVLHTTDNIGMLKCDSAKLFLNRLNPHVEVCTHAERLTNDNAFGIISQYDLVVDCTDTPATRYLISDVSVICGKPVVSGSGVKSDGQITVLNFQNGPCYRCFYPKPPKPESVSTCGDAGVIGPAIGLTGVALAMETIKVLTGYYDKSFLPFLSMYSGYPQQNMRVFKMRNRQSSCAVCGTNPTITREKIESGSIDYAEFCGSVNLNVLSSEFRVSASEFKKVLHRADVTIIDVRPKEQFDIVHLPNSINIAWEHGLSKMDVVDLPGIDKNLEVYVVCRYGNDSQIATKKLLDLGFLNVKDVRGGLSSWSAVDPKFPLY